MVEKQKTIMLTIARGSLIRNFFHTGVVNKLLAHGMRVVVLTQNYKDTELFKEYRDKNLFLEPLIVRSKKYERFFEEFYKGAIFNKTIHFFYKYRLLGKKSPKRILYFPRMIFFAPLCLVPGFKRLIRFLDFLINPERQHDYLFEIYKPDLVFNTASCVDYGVLKSARRYGVKTVDMPKSWDNLSKTLFNVKANYMIVWSEFMRKQAVRFQGYAKKEVVVTGIPQFDFYARKEGLISREEFCKKFGFNPNKKIILFSSIGGNMCSDPHYVELLRRYIDDGEISNVQILIRPHVGYRDDTERFKQFECLDNFAVDRSDIQQSDKFRDHWDASMNHVYNLVNSLYHADVNINIASTMTLDATACGTPVININFDAQKDVEFQRSVRRLFKMDFVKALVDTRGTWLAESEKDFLDALKDILENGLRKEEERQKIIEYFMYKNDGNSAQRIADFLISCVNNGSKVNGVIQNIV